MEYFARTYRFIINNQKIYWYDLSWTFGILLCRSYKNMAQRNNLKIFDIEQMILMEVAGLYMPQGCKI